MINKLDGSFSGLWTCELCGKTGTDCTCEHYQRGGNVWGWHGTPLSDSEAASECWRQQMECVKAFDRAYPYGDGPEVDLENDRMEILERIAKADYASINNYL